MQSKITKAVFALGATLLALAFVVVIALGAWLKSGPKSLTNFLPYVQASLNKDGSPYRIEVADAVVHWDQWWEPVDFRLKGVTVYSRDADAKLLRFNEISVGLSKLGLLRLDFAPDSVIVRSPLMRFYRDEQQQFHVGIGQDEHQRVPLSELMENLGAGGQGDGLMGDISFVRVQNARVLFTESGEDRLLHAEDANVELRRDGDSIHIISDVTFRYGGEKRSYLRGDMRLADEEEMLKAQFVLRDFSPYILSRLFVEQPHLAALDMPLSGSVSVVANRSLHPSLLAFHLQGKEGIFTEATHFAEPLQISALKLDGAFHDNLNHLTLTSAELDFQGATLHVSGEATRYPEGWTADVQAIARNMPTNDLYKYWPKSIAPTAYAWVTTHIREGHVPEAVAKLKITREQLGQPLPEDAVDVNIRAEGVQVNYLDGHPQVEQVKGVVTFNGKGMTITSQEGRMLTGGVLKDAFLQIPDLMASRAPMHIRLQVEAPARDVATYLAIPDLGFSQALGLDSATIGGQAKGSLQFDFRLPDSESTEEDPELRILIEADVENGVQPRFMEDKNLTDAKGMLRITEKELTYHGMMAISGAPLQVALKHSFEPEGRYTTDYTVKGAMPVPVLREFGMPELPFLKGDVGLDLRILRSDTDHAITGTADLTGVAADIATIGLKKEAAIPAKLQFDVVAGEKGLDLKSFDLQGKEMRISGKAKLAPGFDTLEMAKLDRVEYGDNNFTLDISRAGDVYQVTAKGPSLDMKPLFADTGEQATADASGEEYGDYPFAFRLNADFEWVVFGKERELRRVTARADCAKTHCRDVHVKGLIGQANRFTYRILPEGQGRNLNFSADNAGALLRAVNLYDNMVGGTIDIRGRFDDTTEKRQFTGKIFVSEHNIINAPVLAKMASLLSLSGIGDALQGKGITFKEMTGDLGYEKGRYIVRNGRSYGSSLGITVEEGWMNTRKKFVYANGTVVPSYTLNTVLGNIPLIGDALSGGKGEGIFAASYKIEGVYPDHVDVTVNPLTMLAPGFLRNIFGGGGGGAEAEAAAEADGRIPAPPTAEEPPAAETPADNPPAEAQPEAETPGTEQAEPAA